MRLPAGLGNAHAPRTAPRLELPPPDSATISWVELGGRFCLEFGAGTLGALAFVHPAPVGPPFYRLLGALAAVPLLLGLWLLSAAQRLDGTIAICGFLAVVAIPFFAWPTKGRGRWIALATAMGAGAAAVVLGVRGASFPGLGLSVIAAASALASGLLVGAIGVAMVLGHSYLTYPNLKVTHLVRVNRVTALVLLAKAVLVAATLVLFSRTYGPLEGAVASVGGLFGLMTRFAVGLAVPFLFALMVASSLRYQNTRSATGILYASTVLVLIGEAVAMSLRGQTGGLPL